MSGSVVALISVAVMVTVAGYLVASMLYSIRQEKKSANLRKTWKNFGLSIAFALLFFVSWAAQGLTEWQHYKDQQQQHGAPIEVTGFVHEFAQSTLENWQSEFLQLFSFVVLSALYIHHGSAESKDSDDRIEQTLRRIEDRVKQLAGER